jgi:hypothetical protein
MYRVQCVCPDCGLVLAEVTIEKASKPFARAINQQIRQRNEYCGYDSGDGGQVWICNPCSLWSCFHDEERCEFNPRPGVRCGKERGHDGAHTKAAPRPGWPDDRPPIVSVAA